LAITVFFLEGWLNHQPEIAGFLPPEEGIERPEDDAVRGRRESDEAVLPGGAGATGVISLLYPMVNVNKKLVEMVIYSGFTH
jgi:hypothetical protein